MGTWTSWKLKGFGARSSQSWVAGPAQCWDSLRACRGFMGIQISWFYEYRRSIVHTDLKRRNLPMVLVEVVIKEWRGSFGGPAEYVSAKAPGDSFFPTAPLPHGARSRLSYLRTPNNADPEGHDPENMN